MHNVAVSRSGFEYVLAKGGESRCQILTSDLKIQRKTDNISVSKYLSHQKTSRRIHMEGKERIGMMNGW